MKTKHIKYLCQPLVRLPRKLKKVIKQNLQKNELIEGIKITMYYDNGGINVRAK